LAVCGGPGADGVRHPCSIIFISGDRHEFAAAIIREKVLDFSISPLNQFYLPVSLCLYIS
jgi:alkaline phosphatase D